MIATNRHVAEAFSQGLGLNIRYRTGDAAVNFKREIDTPDDDSTTLAVLNVEMIHPYWDMALLKVAGLPTTDMLRLSTTPPEEIVGRNVAVIGYPARDDRSDLALQDRIFGGKYFVKRLQPGVVRERAKVQSFQNQVDAITHDASTLGGNSGSAVIDVDTGDVVALHFAGEYLKANYAVPMYELARDAQVAPKLNFEGVLAPTTDWAFAWRSIERDEVPNVTADWHISSPESRTPTALAPHRDKSTICTIPVQITVAVGPPAEPALPWQGAEPQAPSGIDEAVVVDQDYTNRPGYVPDFLTNIVVPLPAITNEMKQETAQVRSDARRNGDPYELAYYHYSVYMNKRRRTAWFSAANVDGDQRPNIGKRQGDRWYMDPRILKSEQLGQEAFEHGIDRGHLTRREDAAWGEDVDIAVRANNDTFHFTNCSLQASLFNRSKDRWQGLEQFLLEKHAKKEKRRMIVITGPLFAVNDPVYRNDHMAYVIRCPLQFWKVCVLIRQDGTPSITAFILGQEDIQNLPGFEESLDVAATQIKVADLEKRTGLDFGNIKRFDNFALTGEAGTLELPAGGGWTTRSARIIRAGSDIVV
jgi:endonuclease G